MVNPLHILAGAGAAFQKRDVSYAWSSVISTSFSYVSQPTSVTVFGYNSVTSVASGSMTVYNTIASTTSSTWTLATSPLTVTSSPDPTCTTNYAALSNDLSMVEVQTGMPMFMVGYAASCLPTGWGTVAFYSPGICPSGYSLATERILSTGKILETQGVCCFKYDLNNVKPTFANSTSSFSLNTVNPTDQWNCMTFFNPSMTMSGGSMSMTSTVPITPWTVTAGYTSVTASAETYNTTMPDGGMIMTYQRTSTIPLGTATQLSVLSGGGAAMIVAPTIQVRWQSTDQAVMNWLKSQSTSSMAPPSNSTTTPTPVPKHHGLSSGKIAGIVIGALAGLGLIIGALVLCLIIRRHGNPEIEQVDTAEHVGKVDKEMTESIAPSSTNAAALHSLSADVSQVQQPELDSRTLSPAQYLLLNSPQQNTQPRPFSSPMEQSANLPMSSYTPPSRSGHSPTQSMTGNTLNDRSRSPSEYAEQQRRDISGVAETDMHGFLMAAPGASSIQANNSRASLLLQEQQRVREERARLMRVQELTERDARLEEELQSELAGERP